MSRCEIDLKVRCTNKAAASRALLARRPCGGVCRPAAAAQLVPDAHLSTSRWPLWSLYVMYQLEKLTADGCAPPALFTLRLLDAAAMLRSCESKHASVKTAQPAICTGKRLLQHDAQRALLRHACASQCASHHVLLSTLAAPGSAAPVSCTVSCTV